MALNIRVEAQPVPNRQAESRDTLTVAPGRAERAGPFSVGGLRDRRCVRPNDARPDACHH